MGSESLIEIANIFKKHWEKSENEEVAKLAASLSNTESLTSENEVKDVIQKPNFDVR